MPSMESSRYGHVTFLTHDLPPRIATCGGYSGVYKRDCLVLQDGGWRGGKLDDLPDDRYWSATARVDAGVFILGGSRTPSSSVFLRANSRSWETGPQLPVSMRYGPCAAPISAHSFLIVYGTDVYEFDTRVDGPTSNAGWGEWPQLQVSRIYWPGCAVFKRKLIIAGGYPDLKSTEIIDLERKTIESGENMAKPRYKFHLLSIQGSLLAVGGAYYAGGIAWNYLADVEEFVEETETWKAAKAMPGKRSGFGGVAVNFDLVCG